MSITGQVGHVAFAKQTAWDTANITPANYKAVKITGDSLVAANNTLVAEGEIGLGRDVSQAVPGGFSAAGAINGNLTARAAALFLNGALGTQLDTTADATNAAVSGFTPADDLPLFTVEKKVGTATPNAWELLTLRYTNVMVNTLNISATAGGLSTFSAGLIASREDYIPTGPVATVAYPANVSDLLVFHGGRVRIKDSTDTDAVTFAAADNSDDVTKRTPMQSLEVVVNNNVAADEYSIRPSRFLRSLTEGIRSVEINTTIIFEDNATYRRFTYGSATANSPQYNLYMGAIDFQLANWQLADTDDSVKLAPTGAPANPQAVDVTIPKLAFSGLPVALSSGRIAVSTTARALKPTTGNIVKAYVRPIGAAF